jgi:hypothetical protein
MRKLLPFLAFAAAVAVATPAFAYPDERYPVEPYVAPIAGAAVGTAVGVGHYNGWYTGAFAASLPATAVGAAAIGGVAGIGTVALVEGLTAHCHGFGVIWTPRDQCVDGVWVGDQPIVHRRHAMR